MTANNSPMSAEEKPRPSRKIPKYGTRTPSWPKYSQYVIAKITSDELARNANRNLHIQKRHQRFSIALRQALKLAKKLMAMHLAHAGYL
jgi:hypothetical protein